MDDVGRLWRGVLICIAIIFIMSFFNACENALIEMNDARAKRYIREHKRGKTLAKLLEKPNRLVMTNLISQSIMMITLSAAAAVYFYEPFRSTLHKYFRVGADIGAAYYAVSFLTFCLVICVLALAITVFGVILPKRLFSGGRVSDSFALRTCVVYNFFLCLFTPVQVVASVITTGLLRMFGIKNIVKHEAVTEEEILMMVDAVNETGGIEETQAEMISNIFEFDDLEVSDIMTHRTGIVGIKDTATLGDAIKLITDEGFSRIPVYKDNIDNICGVVFAKDLLKLAFENDASDKSIALHMRSIKYVPESYRCSELLEFFTTTKKQIAVVVDEYGGTAGIVTMEDLLESIVGNIQDEYDDEDEEIQEITPNTFDILGKADPDDTMEELGKKLPDDHDYDTMGGFLMDLLGYIPSEGEKPILMWENIEFSILKVSEKRIEKIRAVIKKEDTVAD